MVQRFQRAYRLLQSFHMPRKTIRDRSFVIGDRSIFEVGVFYWWKILGRRVYRHLGS